MSLYTKTALKKIKKDELIQMFLDQQGKLNIIQMDIEEKDPKCLFMYKAKIRELKEENEKLKEERIELVDDKIKLLQDKKELLQENNKLKEENKKLKKDLEDTEYTRNYENKEWQKSYEKLEEDYQKVCEERNARMNKEQEQKLEKENEKLKEDLTTSQYQYDMAIQIDNKKIAELEEEIAELKETLKAYWSGFQLGNADAWHTPDSWQGELEAAEAED